MTAAAESTVIFDGRFARELAELAVPWQAEDAPNPELLVLNTRLAQDLGLDACFTGDDDEPLTLSFPGGSGRWGIGRSTFREQGLPHELLVLTELRHTLREEERQTPFPRDEADFLRSVHRVTPRLLEVMKFRRSSISWCPAICV